MQLRKAQDITLKLFVGNRTPCGPVFLIVHEVKNFVRQNYPPAQIKWKA